MTIADMVSVRDAKQALYDNYAQKNAAYNDALENYQAQKAMGADKETVEQFRQAKVGAEQAKKDAYKSMKDNNATAGEIAEENKKINQAVGEQEQKDKEDYANAAELRQQWKQKEYEKAIKEGASPEEASEHISEHGDYKAVIYKDSHYANNSYLYLNPHESCDHVNKPDPGTSALAALKRIDENSGGEHKEKGIYADFPYLAMTTLPQFYQKQLGRYDEAMAEFRFPAEPPDEDKRKQNGGARQPFGVSPNFNPKAYYKDSNGKYVYARQAYPYSWEAHHMVPLSAFYLAADEKTKKPVFSDPAVKSILLQSEYNINFGDNMIMLPENNRGSLAHTLIQHPSDHREYTKMVQEQLQVIEKQLEALIDKGKHPKPKNVVTELKKVEDKLWNILVTLSRKLAKQMLGDAVMLSEQEANIHKQQTESSNVTYPLGALR